MIGSNLDMVVEFSYRNRRKIQPNSNMNGVVIVWLVFIKSMVSTATIMTHLRKFFFSLCV